MTYPVGTRCASLAESSPARYRVEPAQIKSHCSNLTESRPGTLPWQSEFTNWRSPDAWGNSSRSGKRRLRGRYCAPEIEGRDRNGCSGRIARDKGARKMQLLERL